MTKKLISIVTPAYNEEDCVEELYSQLSKVMNSLNNYDFEVIIVENGSKDCTFQKLLAIHKKDNRFKILRLSRNFFADGGITAGLKHIKGDAAIMMCADLQDSPDLIPQFIKKWEEGYENVFAIVNKRVKINIIRRINSQLFYMIINRLTKNLIPKNASDYRLIDKKIYQVINSMNERSRFVRGMVAWTGFKSIGIPFDRQPRFAGKSNAPTLLTIKLALAAILGFSNAPLKIASFLGIAISSLSFLALFVLTAKFILFGVPFPGFGTIVCLFLLMFGMLFTILGIIGEYVGMIFEEVKGRPNFIVKDKFGIED